LDVLLGIDLGTSNIKAVAYSRNGKPVSSASAPTPTEQQGPRRALHDAEGLWLETARLIREVVSGLPGDASVDGLAVASVGEAGIPLGDEGEALYPIIAWYDERTAPQCQRWGELLGPTVIYQETGLPLGHTFTLNKTEWLRENEPDVFRKMRKWLSVCDYVAYRLTGEQCMGYSQASRTMALDLKHRRWSQEMLGLGGILAGVFPDLRQEGTLYGLVTAVAGHATGLRQGTQVFVGGHDHICGGLAMGVFRPGVVLDSTGTTEAELVALTDVDDHLAAADLSFCLGCHAARERYYAIGSILGAGSMVSWLAGILWPFEGHVDREAALVALTEAAAGSPMGVGGLFILPHLAGAGSPDRDSTARGVFAGVTLEHTRSDMARAAIEGLAYELRVLWEALERFTGHPITRVVAVGGGARNTLWSQIKADVSGRELEVPESAEAVTLGAAILAGIGAGVYRDEEDACSAVAQPVSWVRPRPDCARYYDSQYHLLMREIRPLAVELGRKGALLSALR
jgi:xylulokinase